MSGYSRGIVLKNLESEVPEFLRQHIRDRSLLHGLTVDLYQLKKQVNHSVFLDHRLSSPSDLR
ncbi:hypothetical protein D3C87_2149690 [compost metagenome]